MKTEIQSAVPKRFPNFSITIMQSKEKKTAERKYSCLDAYHPSEGVNILSPIRLVFEGTPQKYPAERSQSVRRLGYCCVVAVRSEWSGKFCFLRRVGFGWIASPSSCSLLPRITHEDRSPVSSVSLHRLCCRRTFLKN